MIPSRYANILFSVILTCLMSLVVSGVATFRTVGLDPRFPALWMAAWIPSWGVAFPVVLVVAPLSRRLVAAMVRRES